MFASLSIIQLAVSLLVAVWHYHKERHKVLAPLVFVCTLCIFNWATNFLQLSGIL